MISINNWLLNKANDYSERVYLIDLKRQITYSENYRQIQKLANKFRSFPVKQNIVFIGTGSIESYQLSFAVMSIGSIWIPISYRMDKDSLNSMLSIIKPSIIIYDSEIIGLGHISHDRDVEVIDISSIFDDTTSVNQIPANLSVENEEDTIISSYLTSGSTGLPKVVRHGWYATLQHADATVRRYQFDSGSRLFNPRHLFHVSGAFALTTIMHCGGSIVIPQIDSYKKSEEECLLDWANMMLDKSVSHASFFPTEMKKYADLIESHPHLNPGSLKRITTGGEEVEFSDLVRVSRAFASNKTVYDLLWTLYPYLGDGKLFTFSKMVFEYLYGSLVQVTQTYGATELICNAIANSPNTGPDPRGIGSVLDSLHPEIVDEHGMTLPQNGLAIGRLRFFGSSIASGYLNVKENMLTPHCYETNDLASISNGTVKLFGRHENLIKLPNETKEINPTVLERKLAQLKGVNAAIIFKYNDKLHAAIQHKKEYNQSLILRSLKHDKDFLLITSISLWDSFPVSLPGKIDRKGIITEIAQEKGHILAVNKDEPSQNFIRMKFCGIV